MIFFILVIQLFMPEASIWRVRNMVFILEWLISNIQTRSIKQRGEPEQSESASKSFSPVPFGAWLSNCVDGHAKFRKLKLSRVFFSPGEQLKGGDRTDRKLRGRHDIPLDELSFQPTVEKVEWLLCSGWKRKVITLGARGGNSWVQIKWWQDFCREERTKKALKWEYERHS